MPPKPTKWGIKVWEFCDSATGYCLDFNIYNGKDNNQPCANGVRYDVIQQLSQRFINKHYHFYCGSQISDFNKYNGWCRIKITNSASLAVIFTLDKHLLWRLPILKTVIYQVSIFSRSLRQRQVGQKFAEEKATFNINTDGKGILKFLINLQALQTVIYTLDKLTRYGTLQCKHGRETWKESWLSSITNSYLYVGQAYMFAPPKGLKVAACEDGPIATLCAVVHGVGKAICAEREAKKNG